MIIIIVINNNNDNNNNDNNNSYIYIYTYHFSIEIHGFGDRPVNQCQTPPFFLMVYSTHKNVDSGDGLLYIALPTLYGFSEKKMGVPEHDLHGRFS